MNRDEILLLAAGEEDNKPLEEGEYHESQDGSVQLVPYTPEEKALLEAERAIRNAQRLQMALNEFGAMNLEVRARVEAIRVKYSLTGTWVGGVNIKTLEGS